MHCVAFTFDIGSIEQWRNKKLCEAIQRRLQLCAVDFKKIIGVFGRGVGVVATTVLVDKCLVITGLRIFFCTEKKHVLKKMREPRTLRRILVMPHEHVQCGCSFFRCRIGNQQYAQFISQYDITIIARILLSLNHVKSRYWQERYGCLIHQFVKVFYGWGGWLCELCWFFLN